MKNTVSTGCYILKSGENSLDLLSVKTKEISIENEVNSDSNLFISHFADVEAINILVKKDSHLVISLLFENSVNDLKINIKVEGNAMLKGYFADFSQDKLDLNCEIDLVENNATSYIKLASLSSKTDDKKISVSVNHLVPQTYGKVDNYGVCKDSGKLLFAGTSHIFEKAIKSKTQQNAKIMVFDEMSNAIAKPILKIDENDIEASHAAAVGKINDEHLFYMTSRGISEVDAKQLITLGYLKPILAGFNHEETREYISSLIERRM